MYHASDTVGSDAVPSCVMLCCGGMLCCCVMLCCHAMLCCAMSSLLTAPNEHGMILLKYCMHENKKDNTRTNSTGSCRLLLNVDKLQR